MKSVANLVGLGQSPLAQNVANPAASLGGTSGLVSSPRLPTLSDLTSPGVASPLSCKSIASKSDSFFGVTEHAMLESARHPDRSALSEKHILIRAC